MMETKLPNCPVISFKKYLQKLNSRNEFLFQRPKKSFDSGSDVWYDNQVVGENSILKMMKVISKKAELSHIYTNHSIRATSVTVLDDSGLERGI